MTENRLDAIVGTPPEVSTIARLNRRESTLYLAIALKCLVNFRVSLFTKNQ